MPGQGMIPEQDVVIAFSIKELFVEIRDDIKLMASKMDDKASRADLAQVIDRLDHVDTRLNENDTWKASLRAYVIGTAVGSSLLSGGVLAGLLKVIH